MRTPTNQLLVSLRTTSGSRFNAARRLAERDKRLTQVTAFSSVLVIALTVLPYVLKSPPEVADLYNLVTIALSLIILVASLLQYSTGDAVNAEQHHRSGLEINETFRVAHQKAVDGVIPSNDLTHLNERFNAILQKYSVNHDEIDYLKYQLDHSEEHAWLGSFSSVAGDLVPGLRPAPGLAPP
jgi:hypothetical protein